MSPGAAAQRERGAFAGAAAGLEVGFGAAANARAKGPTLAAVAKAGSGVVLYMQPANSDETLVRCLTAAPGEPLVPMGFRDYGLGAQILVALGLKKIQLLSNSTRKVVGLDGYGLEIVEQVPL